jgi:malate/lactate dehydrogenase
MKLSFVLNENDFYPDELITDAELTFVDGVVESIELKLNANEKKQFNSSVKAVKTLTNLAQKLIKKRQY